DILGEVPEKLRDAAVLDLGVELGNLNQHALSVRQFLKSFGVIIDIGSDPIVFSDERLIIPNDGVLVVDVEIIGVAAGHNSAVVCNGHREILDSRTTPLSGGGRAESLETPRNGCSRPRIVNYAAIRAKARSFT